LKEFSSNSVVPRLSETKSIKILVYVIGSNAVQFGKNWMNKILMTAKLDYGLQTKPNLAVRGISF